MRIKEYAILTAETPEKLNSIVNNLLKRPENYMIRLYGDPFTYHGPTGFQICQAVIEEEEDPR